MPRNAAVQQANKDLIGFRENEIIERASCGIQTQSVHVGGNSERSGHFQLSKRTWSLIPGSKFCGQRRQSLAVQENSMDLGTRIGCVLLGKIDRNPQNTHVPKEVEGPDKTG